MKPPVKSTNLLDADSSAIIKLLNSIPQNTIFEMPSDSEYGKAFSIFGYLIYKGKLDTIEDICKSFPEKIEEFFSFPDVVQQLMATNAKFSEYMLLILKDVFSKKHFQSYLLYSNYPQKVIERFLVYCEFETAYDAIISKDNAELLKKFLSSPEQYNTFSRIVSKREGNNLWQKCIDLYAVECEAALKEMILISRAI